MNAHLSRRHLLALLGALAGESCRRTSPSLHLAHQPVSDALIPLPLHDVRLAGSLGRKLDLCVRNRIQAQNAAALVEPFRHRTERTCWQTEFWGKWFTSAAAACDYTGSSQERAKLAASVRDLLATQSPDGYIGNYPDASHLLGWDVWGRKYTLLGLLAWYDLTADPAALSAARRLADHLLTEIGPGKADIVTLGLYRGMPASSVLQPIVRLYRRTREERYFHFAEYILERWSSDQGPQLIEKAGVPVGARFPAPKKWWSWENGQKAYEMMSCYTGLLELYRETGWKPALDAAVRTFESIRDTEINVAGSGSAAECWYAGKSRQTEPRPRFMETCVGVSWMELCSQLLRLTSDPRYADEIERTAYNALAGAMTPDGSSFAQYSALEGVRALGERHCGMDINCCVANGPRGMMLLPGIAVMMRPNAGPAVSLYTDGTWRFPSPSGAPARLEMKTDYPSSGDIDLRIEPQHPESFSVLLRIPSWSDRHSVTVNGAPFATDAAPGRWAVIERRWNPGDRVRLRLALEPRLLKQAGHTALVRGPVALSRDARFGAAIDEPVSLPSAALKPIPPPPGIEMAFSAADGKLQLCDYASAGNTWDPRSRYRVWLPQS